MIVGLCAAVHWSTEVPAIRLYSPHPPPLHKNTAAVFSHFQVACFYFIVYLTTEIHYYEIMPQHSFNSAVSVYCC